MQTSTRLRINSMLLGAATSAIAYIYTERAIFRSTAKLVDSFPANQPLSKSPLQTEKVKPLFGTKFRQAFVRKWNKGIDYVFGGLATELAKRGL